MGKLSVATRRVLFGDCSALGYRESEVRRVTQYTARAESLKFCSAAAVCGPRSPADSFTDKKRTPIGSVFFFWWGKLDSDQRSQWQQIYSLPPLAAREFPHISWSWWTESNHQPADYKSAALPLSHTSVLNSQHYNRKIELCQYFFIIFLTFSKNIPILVLYLCR